MPIDLSSTGNGMNPLTAPVTKIDMDAHKLLHNGRNEDMNISY
jgi:hypothetical protein